MYVNIINVNNELLLLCNYSDDIDIIAKYINKDVLHNNIIKIEKNELSKIVTNLKNKGYKCYYINKLSSL
tara:strand:- start:6 stop:215 length:210 start_codon:yes stop_codon:yes gene_type:complete